MSNDNQMTDEELAEAIRQFIGRQKQMSESELAALNRAYNKSFSDKPTRLANNQPAISKEEVKEEIIDRYLDQFWNGEIFDVDAVSAAMTEYTDLQTAALREENTRLKAELAEMVEALERIDWGWKQKAIISKHKP